ncbi:ciliary neurotrophic factor receptor subunit alpha isoform X2 [Anolis carolinensis]|uniref:Ciliary neurotrophic factor receptor subunit alpha n=2 Tax=Anolis carolinensis TaxID=28377 RepID=H9GKQ7_ANOCA|nr:PREDICTED: ciliary neurotrophic factor receptor subunit alpha [Anolis carolinensis]XP_016851800.1 PREDICTED: ciliary neurotrophic factor receptor subunit alpha [Anolis carolinensis]XP_016851801.1 PREDICTED: ciliary neurotrophic factor receptor subunit alpha [Anolis carolinensis]XP_016851802.1 PREDICTED: ciliary neurotrophic factor receptor subunit alpha [Anolis carolinensis]XP_016851803.1 PREDICTED: ciliary neurotrophic factor receptor subunit alpha [Anolis carolinensis]XP_016851804.1 PREDI|eukprot:XP_008116073.1 PREDICTED: ciliary neurotrophic factor receptor subunit alpha [Anolis carolinensis]
MAFPVSAACWVVLAAAVALGYVQRHSQQESHVHYAQLGTDVTLQCGSVDPEATVTWTANTTDLDASHLNGSRLVLHNVDLSQSGQYSCYEGTSWHLKYRVNLKVGTPPKEPVLMCRSNNYPNGFYCSWHLPSPTYMNDTYDITIIHDSKEIACKKDIPAKNRCYIQYHQVFSSKKYRVTLTATNPLGSSSTTISFDEFSIVKPDPPESVVAKPIAHNPRRLQVTWQYPSSWPDPDSFPLKFFLRYRPLIIDQWQHVELSDGTSHIITDAYAGKEYIIQVAAKDNEIGTWSDWSVAVHATPWTEEPKHLTTEAQGTETTTASTSAFMVAPTARPSDPDDAGNNASVALSLVVSLVLVLFSIHFI